MVLQFFQQEKFQEQTDKADFPALPRKVSAPGPRVHQTTGHIFLVLQSSRKC